MKNLFLPLFMLMAVALMAQNNNPCSFDQHLEKQLKADPSLMENLLKIEQQAANIKLQRLAGTRSGGGPRIIPVVFHVVHQGGDENISYEQIEDQIRVLNEDYSRTNADASDTRDEFLPVAANFNIEFRLARLDPQGNCTNGVVRVYSPLTNKATDEVKAVSYWNSSRYLNIWVVKDIATTDPGTILGYAQLPGFGAAATDGLVIRADFIGSIGTASSNGYKGRVASHEAGHWFGLFHTFQGECNGGIFGEGVDDTPPIAGPSSGCNHNANTCHNDNPDLPDMVENYMDYSNGSCQNAFTQGQKDRVDAVLSSSRSQIISSGNISFTGVDGPIVNCAPIADFTAERILVCVGDSVTFNDQSFNGTVTDYSWSFENGTPATSSVAQPTVSYATPGVYDVSFTATNTLGSDNYTRSQMITVIPNTTQISQNGYVEGFEGLLNVSVLDYYNISGTWEMATPGYQSSNGFKMNNWDSPSGAVDEFILPSIDMTQVSDPTMTFRLAHRQLSGGQNPDSNDEIRVYISKNCGESWTLRFSKSGNQLAIGSPISTEFTPSSDSDWDDFSVNLSSVASEPHVLIKFQSNSNGGNNIYIDNINLLGPASIGKNEVIKFQLSPNPSSGLSMLQFTLPSRKAVNIDVLDIAGRVVKELENGQLSEGSHQYFLNQSALGGAGIYLIRITTNNQSRVERLIFN